MNKNRIYIKDWLRLKPYESQTLTDSYYLKLTNETHKILIKKHSDFLNLHLNKEQIINFSCFIVSYFEDIISETNIWTSFVAMHKELYGSTIPFYDDEEYFDKEINEVDVNFLTWYFLNTAQEDDFIFSFNPYLLKITIDVFEILEEEYEFAPENKVLKKYYQIDKKETDYYIARSLMDNVLFKTYLFFTDTFFDLKESEIEIIDTVKNKKELDIFHINSLLNENRDRILHNSYTRLLSLKGNEWVAKIIGKDHPLHNDYLNISKRISGFFFYKGQDDQNIFLEHIASGMNFNLTKKSFDNYSNLKHIDTIVYIGMVKWREEWWFSGTFYNKEFDADFILDEKNSMESRIAVSFLEDSQKINEVLELQYNAFKELNNGYPIVFIPTNKIDGYLKKYTEFFNDSLNLSNEEKEKAFKRARKEGFFGTSDKSLIDVSEEDKSGLVFFNPKSGIEVVKNANSAFPLPNNIFYKKEDSTDHFMQLLIDESISTELVYYCIDNCKDKLSLFEEILGIFLLEDIDFLLRFFKTNNYHSLPNVSITGKEK